MGRMHVRRDLLVFLQEAGGFILGQKNTCTVSVLAHVGITYRVGQRFFYVVELFLKSGKTGLGLILTFALGLFWLEALQLQL